MGISALSTVAAASTAISTDKAEIARLKRQKSRLARKVANAAAAAATTSTATAAAGPADSPPAVSETLLYPRRAVSAAGFEADLQQLENSWGLPGSGLDNVDGPGLPSPASAQSPVSPGASILQRRDSAASTAPSPELLQPTPAPIDMDTLLEEEMQTGARLGRPASAARAFAPSQLPSILGKVWRTGLPPRQPAAASSSTSESEAVGSAWGKARQSLRSENHGKSAIAAAQALASIKLTKAEQAARASGRGKNCDTMHGFLKVQRVCGEGVCGDSTVGRWV